MPTEDIAVTKFREYLRINTEQPSPDYESCCKFLFSLADELGIQRKIVEVVPGKPFVIMTIPGSKPELSSIVLYSHTDVVPTFKDQWKYDPYSAHKDEQGNIYARGAQDMKCVGSQYFEAIRRHFMRGKKQWLRNIHIVWGPDEEIGAVDGMAVFVKTPQFRELNMGFMLDEGLASESSTYKVYYAERSPWWVEITCRGSPGHGSKFIEDTAAEKLQSIINNVLAFREQQRAILRNDQSKQLGDVTTVNITQINGGVQVNVIPDHFTIKLDIRIPPVADFDKMEAIIADWCKKAGPGVTCKYFMLLSSVIYCTISFIDEELDIRVDLGATCLLSKSHAGRGLFLFITEKNGSSAVTTTSMDDPFWSTFENSLRKEKCKFDKEIFSGATDSRFVRELGYRSIGFSPMINTPSLLHDHNEYLNESVFLRGVEIYETLIDGLANVESV